MLKKVLIVNWQDIKNPQAGGAEAHLHEVGKRLVRRGVQCVLYCHRPTGFPAEEVVDGIHVFRRGSRWLFNFVTWFGVRRWVRLHRPDVVIDDSNKIPFFLPWLVSRPVVVRVHHLLGKTVFLETDFLRACYVFFLEWCAPLSWRHSPVITVSHSTEMELRQRGIKDIAVCHNGVEQEALRRDAAWIKKENVIGYMGRVKRYKNLEVLLRAVRELKREIKKIRLEIAGDGDDVPRLKKLADQYGVSDSVGFMGYLSPRDKARFYAESTVLANPSSKEGWGLTTIEANTCGSAVVAFDVPGLRDSILNGETGLLVLPGDEKAFQSALRSLLSDSALREKMESNAVERAKKFTWDRCFDSTLEVLERAAGKGELTGV